MSSAFENRGIFRNPLSFIEGTYKGISMLLHGFSAAVHQRISGKRMAYFNAIRSMQVILFAGMGPSKLYYRDGETGPFVNFHENPCYLKWKKNPSTYVTEFTFDCLEVEIYAKVDELISSGIESMHK